MKKFLAIFIVPALALAALAGPARSQEIAVTVKDIEPFPYCAIAHKGPYSDIGAVIGQLIAAMQTQALFPQVRGVMVGVYYNSPGDTKPADLSWEVGFVVSAQAAPQPPLLKKVWEHKTVAVAMHVGPYDKIGATIEKITAWLAAHGYKAGGPILERYFDQNPMAVKPDELRTEIWVPCKKK